MMGRKALTRPLDRRQDGAYNAKLSTKANYGFFDNEENGMAKVAFSRSDVMAINGRMSGKSTAPKADYSQTSSALSRSPSSPVAAKVMREIGVSSKKISEAYRFAKTTTNRPK
jgi:hypothetical protein